MRIKKICKSTIKEDFSTFYFEINIQNSLPYSTIPKYSTLRNYLGWPDFLKKRPPTFKYGRPLHFPTNNKGTTFLRDRWHFLASLFSNVHHMPPPLSFDRTSPILADVLLCNFLEYQHTGMCVVPCPGICTILSSIELKNFTYIKVYFSLYVTCYIWPLYMCLCTFRKKIMNMSKL